MTDGGGRRLRADAQRNVDAVLEAARVVFARSGVEAPAKEIGDLAGVGVGTIYRHYPKRSDLAAAVFQREVDACAAAATSLSAEHPPGEALQRWVARYTEFLATKRGLATALHSGDPALETLAQYFQATLEPVLAALMSAAADSGEIRPDVAAVDLLRAVANVCQPADTVGPGYSRRMVALLLDGLRHGAAGSG